MSWFHNFTEEDASYDSEDGAGDIKISSSSKEAPANPAGGISFSSQSSKLQTNQKARSRRPGPLGEMFIHIFRFPGDRFPFFRFSGCVYFLNGHFSIRKIPWIETGYTRHLHIMLSVWTAHCCVNEKACTRIITYCVSNRKNWQKLSSPKSTGLNDNVHLSSFWLLTVMQIVMLLPYSEENIIFSSDVRRSWRVAIYFACRLLLFSLHTHVSKMYLFSQRTITRSYQLDISFNTLSLIYMMLSSPSSGMGILPTTDQRRAPLRPGLANTERSRAEHLPTNRASPLSWGVLPVGCSFGDSHENHRALTEAKRISKKDERKTSAGQSFRGKVGHWIATCKLTFKPRIPPLNCHTCASLWQWSEEREGTDKKHHFWNFFLQLTLHDRFW